jgi:hypothetical protein
MMAISFADRLKIAEGNLAPLRGRWGLASTIKREGNETPGSRKTAIGVHQPVLILIELDIDFPSLPVGADPHWKKREKSPGSRKTARNE